MGGYHWGGGGWERRTQNQIKNIQGIQGLGLKGIIGAIWGFPKTRGTLLGVPIIRIIVFGGLYWGTPILGNYHIGTCGVFWVSELGLGHSPFNCP